MRIHQDQGKECIARVRYSRNHGFEYEIATSSQNCCQHFVPNLIASTYTHYLLQSDQEEVSLTSLFVRIPSSADQRKVSPGSSPNGIDFSCRHSQSRPAGPAQRPRARGEAGRFRCTDSLCCSLCGIKKCQERQSHQD